MRPTQLPMTWLCVVSLAACGFGCDDLEARANALSNPASGRAQPGVGASAPAENSPQAYGQAAASTQPEAKLAPGERSENAGQRAASPEAAEEQPPGPDLGRYFERQPPEDVPRVYAKSRNVWIRGKPTSKTQWIGFLWFGSSVKLREPEPVAGYGCRRWYAIEPRGYVCVDEKKATLNGNDPVLREIYPLSPDRSQPNPHPFYGESIGAERYHHPPSLQRMRAREWYFRFHDKRIAEARSGGEVHESLLGIDLSLPQDEPIQLSSMPHGMQEGHKQLIPRSAVAWTREFSHEGRGMVLADDLTWVPKDRIKPYPRIDFQGIHLQGDVQLPIALFREKDRPSFEQSGGQLIERATNYPRLSWVQLTDERVKQGDTEYVKTVHGDFIRVEDAVIPEPRDQTPWGAPVGGQDDTGKAPKGRGSWIQVSILGGWLVAFEGTKPVFATLMSPGKGGPPQGKLPTLKTASTPTGWFKITGKFVTSTMIAPNDLVHSAVPWAQNFSGPYALHGAYWHNDWGEPKSGGCINVSPKDGAFLFEFTEPRIPEGWHGVRWVPGQEGSTGLIVGR